jgi:hypothetical protein
VGSATSGTAALRLFRSRSRCARLVFALTPDHRRSVGYTQPRRARTCSTFRACIARSVKPFPRYCAYRIVKNARRGGIRRTHHATRRTVHGFHGTFT